MSSGLLLRQRVLLDLLLQSPAPPTKFQLMKWAFLLREKTDIADRLAYFDFVPYHYGPFSFALYRELGGLRQRGLVEDDRLAIPRGSRKRATDEIGKLPALVRARVEEVLESYAPLSSAALRDTVYDGFPWYASRSRLRPATQRPKNARPAGYTVGYEGRSVDAFLGALLNAGIERVVDVRKNAYSRKYGFIGSTLAGILAKLEIGYVHVPELGVPSSLRQDLGSDASYEQLFEHYEAEILPKYSDKISSVVRLQRERPSALLCFEACSTMCHRGRLAAAISADHGLREQHL